MRILGEIEKQGIKFTLFSMNDKVSIKAERDLLEQIYKFRDGSNVENYQEAFNFIDEIFINNVQDIFKKMSSARYERWKIINEMDSESSLETII